MTAGLLALGAWAAMALGGCGAGADACSSVTACGGDIVGSWTITSDCHPPSPYYLAGQCDTAYAVGPPTTGTFTYNSDLTYTTDITVGGFEMDTWAPACYPVEQCAQLEALLRGQSTVTSASCTRASSCTCRIENAPVSGTDVGTYTTTAEGLLTRTAAGLSSGAESDYCVKGKTLTMSSRIDGHRFTLTKR